MSERRLVLVKGEHRYVFRIEVGREAQFLSALADLADNDRLNFDWLDAAFFCRLVGAAPNVKPPAAR